eukprot:Partr_v1_DN27718_c3_g1_i3_m67410 putative thioredoxin-related transmembrane protein 3
MTKNGVWFVKFFAPWCVHCQHLAPIYEAVAVEYRPLRKSHHFYMAQVDCTVERDLCVKWNVMGYPTLMLLHRGVKVFDYDATHTEEDLKAFLEPHIAELTQKPLSETDTPKEEKKASKKTPDLDESKKEARVKDETKQKADEEPKIFKVEPVTPPVVKEADSKKENEKPATPDVSKEPKENAKPAQKMDGKVRELTTANFKETIASGAWIVEFMAPWCGHCQKLAPIWKDLAGEVASMNVGVGAVDCPANAAIQNAYDIKGFPTIIYFSNGQKIREYYQSRDLKSLKEFVVEMAKPSIVSISSNDLDSLLDNNDVVFLYLTSSKTVDAAVETVAKQAAKDAKFVSSRESFLYTRYGLEKSGDFLLVLKDGKYGIFTAEQGQWDYKSLKQWVDKNKYPALITLATHNSIEIFKMNKWILLAFLDPGSKSYSSHLELLSSLARTADGSPDENVMFVQLDAIQWANYAKSTYGVDTGALPAVIMIHPDGDEYFSHALSGSKPPLETFALRDFIIDAKEGKLSPTHVRGRIGGLYKAVGRGFGGIFSLLFGSAFNTLSTLLIIVAIVYYFIRRQGDDEFRGEKAD